MNIIQNIKNNGVILSLCLLAIIGAFLLGFSQGEAKQREIAAERHSEDLDGTMELAHKMTAYRDKLQEVTGIRYDAVYKVIGPARVDVKLVPVPAEKDKEKVVTWPNLPKS